MNILKPQPLTNVYFVFKKICSLMWYFAPRKPNFEIMPVGLIHRRIHFINKDWDFWPNYLGFGRNRITNLFNISHDFSYIYYILECRVLCKCSWNCRICSIALDPHKNVRTNRSFWTYFLDSGSERIFLSNTASYLRPLYVVHVEN